MGDASGLAFVGCLLLGVGIGLLTEQIAAATTIGLGTGFLAMAFLRRKGR